MSRSNMVSRESNITVMTTNTLDANHVIPRPSTRSACSIPMLNRKSNNYDNNESSSRIFPHYIDNGKDHRRNYGSSSAPSYNVKQLNYFRNHQKTKSADPRIMKNTTPLTRKYNKSRYDSLSPQDFFKERMQTISRASVASRIESIYGIDEEDMLINNNTNNFKANDILKNYNTTNPVSKYILQRKNKPRATRRENSVILPVPNDIPLDTTRMLLVKSANVTPRNNDEDKKLPRLKLKMSQVREGWIEEAISLHTKSKKQSNHHRPAPSDEPNNHRHGETKKVTFSDINQALTDTENDDMAKSLDENKAQSEGWTTNSLEINVVISPRLNQNTIQTEDVPSENASDSSIKKENNEMITSQPQDNCKHDESDNLIDNQQLQEYQTDNAMSEHLKSSDDSVIKRSDPDDPNSEQHNNHPGDPNSEQQNNDPDGPNSEQQNNNIIDQDHTVCNDTSNSSELSATDINNETKTLFIEVANQLVTIEEVMEQD